MSVENYLMKYCECGCGEKIKAYGRWVSEIRRFKFGHGQRKALLGNTQGFKKGNNSGKRFKKMKGLLIGKVV